MSLTFKESLENVYFYELLSQAMCTMCTYKLKIYFNKCLNCYKELLYLINILLNFKV